MPFTVSHVAAVILFARRPLVPSALVVGSMAPDLPYFAAIRPWGGELTHTWWGVALVDVPITLVALLLYRAVLHEPVMALVPEPVRAKAAGLPAPRFGPALLVSALIGALTHVLWDGFTHSDGWALRFIPRLGHDVMPGLGAYKVAQWISGLLGAVLLIWWCRRELARAPERPVPDHCAPPDRPALARIGLVMFALVFTALVIDGPGLEDYVVDAVIAVLSGLILGLALYKALRALGRSRERAGT
ncbi:DUF4184 family protein [Saccharothrix sp.]|uniref:DUF4184 family protein n=1 Tax=Saccharothrix sp. TaxID=1873460 RepID=UPI00281190DE|nr:DUF4184 family protein [Saccharothrix sp.]